jgi:hypothetical protein
MNRLLPLLAAMACLAPVRAEEAPADAAPEAKSKPAPLDWNQKIDSPRSRALEVAADRQALGYHLRDGFWSGTLEKNQPVLIAVHLFAGNDYWFSAANLDPDTRLKVSLFDRWGNPAGGRESEGQGRATAGISAIRSGPHFVHLEMTEGDKAHTCMVYSYK